MKTYIEQCKDKSVEPNQESFDDFVDFWHTSDKTRNMTLHAAIGVTWDEYRENILDSKKMLEFLKTKLN